MEVPKIFHPSWHPHVDHLFKDRKLELIKTKILGSCNFYPSAELIFRVFSMPLYDIKVVILGQDPYPNGEAIGLAFAISENSTKPFSFKIIENDVGHSLPKSLSTWVEQGVFLLNIALTVERRNPSSHLIYWEWFTKEIVKIIVANNPCVWLLWGSRAIGYKSFINQNVFTSPHPAASAYSKSEFSGNFNQVNNLLITKINW